ncbi:MAG: DNA polymerase III subunit delta [Caldisericaceae bacterium]|nr:DNA polymerase III subunit delta [Caldisericaceae bacterium]
MKSPTQVLKEITENKIDRIYLLNGAEKFFQDQVIDALSKKLFPDKGSRDLNKIVLYGTENTQAELLSQFSSYPMLADRKLVIVRDFNKMRIEDPDTFEKYLSKPPKFSVLVLCANETPKNKFFKKVAEYATVVNCKPIYESQMPAWVQQYCQHLGYKIQNEAAHFLVANVGAHILMLKNEIDKVISFKTDDSPISISDLQQTSGVYREANVFALQKALAQRNLSQSIKIVHQLIETGSETTAINAVLFAFFRKALIASSLKRQGLKPTQIAKKMKLAEFQMREINIALQKFTLRQLKKVIQLLTEFDQAQKGIQIIPMPQLELLCYQICRL